MNDTPSIQRKRRRATAALFVCAILLSVGLFALQGVEIWTEPMALPADGKLYLLYRSRSPDDLPEDGTFHRVTLGADGKPADWQSFNGTPGGAVTQDGELWIFFAESISLLDSGGRLVTLKWPLPWSPLGALRVPAGGAGAGGGGGGEA
ncbi:MAG: hypothetical protein HZA54_15965, partial [Planctomycetes bacterium]|nr:hypothetical protein [Planctomycetota bacterium]